MTTLEENQAFLAHFGVKGMKWGVRKDRPGGTAPRTSSDFKKTDALRGRPVSSLSNKQLKELNERLNLEQNHKRLNPTSVERGRQKVQNILATVALGVTAYNIVNSPAGKAAVNLGKKALKKKAAT